MRLRLSSLSMREYSKSSRISMCVFKMANLVRIRDSKRDRECLDKTDEWADSVDDCQEIDRCGDIDADGEISFFPLHCF